MNTFKQYTLEAILRTYVSEGFYFDEIVLIDATHDFIGGPYQDTIPFAVGSNQEVLPVEE